MSDLGKCAKSPTPSLTTAEGGSNPIGYLIPCHRVIRETGIVQGYRWGQARKQALLAREAVSAG